MRALSVLASLFLLLSTGCGSPKLIPVRDGPRLVASLAAEWPASGPARQAVFSHDGRVLAASDASGRITLRETRGWKVIGHLQHPSGATSLAFGNDGSTLFSGGYDGTVRTWDVSRLAQVGVLKGARGTIWTLDISPDGLRVAAAGEDAAIHIWTLDRPAEPATLRGHERNIWKVRFSPDGRHLASGSFDQMARLWDAANGRSLKTLRGHEQAVVGLAFSPDGKLLATSGDDSTIRLWRTADGTALRTVNNGNHTYDVEFSPDGKWLASVGRARGALGTFWHQLTGSGGAAMPVHIWRVSDMALVSALAQPDDALNTAFSRDGRWLVTSGEDKQFRLWRLREVSGRQ